MNGTADDGLDANITLDDSSPRQRNERRRHTSRERRALDPDTENGEHSPLIEHR